MVPQESKHAPKKVKTLRRELEQCQRERDECQKRLKQMESIFTQIAEAIRAAKPEPIRGEAPLAGEKRILEIIANGNQAQFFDAFCRLVEENNRLREDFRDLFEEAPIPYVHEALDTKFIRANRAAMKVLGIKPEEIAGTFGNSFVANKSETQRRLREAFSSVEQGQEASGVELELRRKDNGSPIWVQWWSKPAPGGEYTRTMMVDVTARVTMEQTKAALELTLSSGQIGDWDLDLIRGTSRRSLRYDRCFGYTEPIPEANWGFKEFIQHVHPMDRKRVREDFRLAMNGKKNLEHEFRVVWADGSIHWLESRGSVCRTTDGRATQILGIVMDITERKMAEEALRETKAALEFTLKSAQIGDWDLDLTNDTSRRSLRHDQCFGYNRAIPEAEWGVEVFSKHLHPEDRARVVESLGKAAKELLDWGSEFRVIWPDGSLHWLAARGSIYRTSEGKAARMLGIVMDITERKQAEAALEASEQLARGQVEALKSAVDGLAMEPNPDHLVVHILRTITEQFGAHSSSVWRRDEASSRIGLEFAFEDGAVVTKNDPRFAGMNLLLPMDDFRPWPEVFRTGKPSVIEDIRTTPAFDLQNRLLPLGIITVLLIPMSVLGGIEGAIGLRFTQKRGFRTEELELAQALANQAMLTMQLTRLYGQSRDSAVIAERNRMARDIHDTLAQGFTGIIVQLEAAADAASRGLVKEAEEHRSHAAELARDSLNEARRSVQALRPQALDHRNLSEALKDLILKMTAGSIMQAKFTVKGYPFALPSEWEENLLRIGQEVLTNALRHSHASKFKARLVFALEDIRLDMRDNGYGFDPAGPAYGFGLLGIRERVDGMGGKLTLKSTIGTGTAILIVLPIPKKP
jgi:PAS domain S-box-containing protein